MLEESGIMSPHCQTLCLFLDREGRNLVIVIILLISKRSHAAFFTYDNHAEQVFPGIIVTLFLFDICGKSVILVVEAT